MWWMFWTACSGEPHPEPRLAAPDAHRAVLLVTLDTTRADHLGAYGYADAKTPNLDALAARGTRFSRAYAPVPLTIPSHSTLMTGLLPPRHGVRDNGDHRLPDEAVTLAERLRDAGWKTHASVGAYVTNRDWGFGQGFLGYDDDLGVPSDRLSWRAERRADAVIDDAIAALDGGARFLWVHLFDAHAPYDPPEPFAAEMKDRPYDGEIAYVDQQLGRLLARLPDDALVVVAGDHGEGLGDGGETGHGLLLSESTLHVPLIVAGPEVPAAVDERVVGLVDVTPTILGRLGLSAELDGLDLFAAGERPGVYSETHYGAYHFGWTPLLAITARSGRLVRGARDEGEVPPEALAELERVMALPRAFAEAPATLDVAEIEQLQALGYVASPAAPAPTADAPDPRDGIALVKKMDAATRLEPKEQEEALRDVLAEAPGMRDARIRLANLLSRSARLDEAVAEASLAFQSAPDSTAALLLGHLWLQKGDPSEALNWYREAAAHDPRSPAARAGEVQALVRSGRLDEAAAAAEIALAADPDHAALLLARADLALARGEPVEPWVAPVSDLATTRPYEPRALELAGNLLRAAGDVDEAERMLKEELRWRPGNGMARMSLLELFVESGRRVDALKTLRPLLDAYPEDPRWHAIAARLYLEMGRDELALRESELCKGDPDCPDL